MTAATRDLEARIRKELSGGGITLPALHRALGIDINDVKPRNSVMRLIKAGEVIKDSSTYPPTYKLSPPSTSPATSRMEAVTAQSPLTDRVAAAVRKATANDDHATVLSLLGTDEVKAVCQQCGTTIKNAKPTAETVREIFAHDSSHSVWIRTGSRDFSRRELEEADAAAQNPQDPEVTSEPPDASDEVETFTLPDGREYMPRLIGGLPDVSVLRNARSAGLPVILSGPPGTGKTALVLAAFEDVITITGDGDTAVADLVGTWTMSGDPAEPYVWADGPLTQAMKEGRPLFIDDCTLISPKVLAAAYPVMDGRGRIWVKEHPVADGNGERHAEEVIAQDGFWIVGGHNPGVHGAILTEALSSRFALHVHVPSDYDLAAMMKVSRKAILVARNMQDRIKGGQASWAPQLRELIAFGRIADTLGEGIAIANLAGIAPHEDRQVMKEVIKSAFGREVDALEVGAQISAPEAE